MFRHNGSFVSYILLLFLLSNCTHKSVRTEIIDSRMDTLINSLKKQIFVDPQFVKDKLREELSVSTDSLDMCKLWSLYTQCLYYEQKIDSAIALSHNLIALCERHSDNEEFLGRRAFILNNTGVFYFTQERRDSAAVYYQKSIDAFYEINEKTSIPFIYISLADCSVKEGKLPLAIDYYLKAYSVADSIGQKDAFEFSIYSGMAKLYADLSNFSKAEEYFMRIESQYDERDIYEKDFYATSRGNYYYFNKQNLEKAFYWFEKAKENANEAQNPQWQSVANFNIGEIYLINNQVDSARYYFDKGKEYAGESISPSLQYYYNGLYGYLNLLIGNITKGENMLAWDYSANPVMPLYGYYINKRLEKLYSERNNFRKAYTYRVLADQYDDSLRNITLQHKLAEVSFRYERDTTLLSRNLEISNQQGKLMSLRTQNYLIILISLFALLVIIVIVFYWRKKKNNEFNEQLNQLAILRASNIKNRMKPHYIKNVITAAMPSLRHSLESGTLDLLVKSLRNELLVSDKIFVTLEEELEIVNNYIDLRRSTTTLFPEIKWHVDDEVDVKMRILSMLMEIPVENAIKSAFPVPDKFDYIDISILSTWGKIQIEIIDNGVGFSSGNSVKNDNDTKQGLQILKQTIELLNSRNIEKMEFTIQNASDSSSRPGTKVVISIPLSYKYEL